MVAPQSRFVQQLAEVLATLVASSTEVAATQGAVERVAECFDAEVGALVRDDAVVASVGFRHDGPVPGGLVGLAVGSAAAHGDELEVPGAGTCRSVVVAVPSRAPSRLVLARSGDDGFSLEEVSLLRSMGRILANSLDMLHLRDMVAASEARFRRIVETANEGIWLLAADGSTTFANDKVAEILGYPTGEMGSLSIFDVLDDAGKVQAARNLERRRSGLSDQLECAFLRKDGSYVWVLLNASPLLDGDGSFVGSLCMISDISQRKQMEDVLSRREQQLAVAQRVAGVGSFEWEIGPDRLSWSDELYRLLGLEPGERAPDFDGYLAHVHPEDRHRVVHRLQDAPDVYEAEYRIVRGDDEVVWVQARSEVVRDKVGSPRLLRGTVLDVSASKLTEEALRETTARFRLLQAMATAANEASSLEEAVQVAVDEICAHTGWVAGHAYLPAGTLGDSVVPLSIWHLDDPALSALQRVTPQARLAPATKLVGRVLTTRAPAWAGPGSGAGGSDLERAAAGMGLATFAFPVCVEGEVTCILEFFSTPPIAPGTLLLETIGQVATQLSRVAERQRASNELATARDAAMESSRLKSDFLATMSHEIRTPMNGVIGLTGLLLSTDLDERQRQYSEGVQTAGEALMAIINDILDFSKIEAGRLELEVIEFDPVQVVDEAVALVAQPAQRKGLELIASCSAGLPSCVRGDPARLRQVLLNLVSNAVKFTAVGEVVVSAAACEESEDGVTVRFEVIDTGIGIAAGDSEHLFEPFTQADASTTRRFGGTGLGLAISRQLVVAMGGDLGFDSVPGCGSRFWFTLPLERQAGVAPHPSPIPSHARGLRVLVADDNDTNRRLLADQLRAWGLRCDVAPDGTTALKMLREEAAAGRRYDVGLLDAGMPGMDGCELAQRISADPAVRGLRMVMMTSASTVGRTSTIGAGIAAYVGKPVRASQLAEALVDADRATSPRGASSFHSVPPDVRGHVLVVEDNASNQLVALGILRLLGYRADVASDGAEALDAVGRTDYDTILMDCHMPEMDGFAATREIRRREGDRRHTPVVAMTAGAGPADRERCLAAGMDDFLAKPVRAKEVDAALARWVGTGRVASPPAIDHADVAGPHSEGEVVDPSILEELRELAPDGSLLVAVVDTFLATTPDHLAELRAAVARGDAAPIRLSAHRLRGESSALGAVEVARLCTSLEEMSAEGRVDGAPALVSAIETALGRAAARLQAVVGSTPVVR